MLGGGGTTNTIQGIVENIDKTPQIKYYNYAPNTIKIENGSNTINFNYTPSRKALATTSVEKYIFPTSSDINPKYVKNIDARAGQTIAYEYVFANAMNRSTAVNLKSIGDITDTGVTVSYLWRTTPLTQGEAVTNSPAKFTCQEMANSGDKVYLYVIVTNESASIPADFTIDIVWYYGIPYDMPVYNNINSSVFTTVKLVNGQEITLDVLPDEDSITIPEGYYFDTWFSDKNFEQLIDENTNLKAIKQIYLRLHNVPTGVTTYFQYNNGSYTTFWENNVGTFYGFDKSTVIIPTIYDDGVNGKAQVKSISQYAFYERSGRTGNTVIEIVDLPCTITSIGNEAFRYCSSLTSITIPSSVTSIGSDAFYSCSSLTSIDLSNCTNLTSIGRYAFSSCSSLTSITIPASVTSIGDSAFYGCSSLTSITIPSSVTSIGDYAFYSCSSLTSIDLSNCTNLTRIGTSAFRDCSSLTSITIASSVTRIGSYAFSGCTSLTSITIPSSVTSIGEYVFYYCTKLTSITIPASVTSIGNRAFQDCTSLARITIPASVTSIGSYVFYGCTSLASITFEDPTTWYMTTSSTDWNNKQNGTQTDVSNVVTNVTYFTKSTYDGGYSNYYWYKV